MQLTDLLTPFLRMVMVERLMPNGYPMKGSPGLLLHPGAVGSGRGFSALRVSSSAVTGRNRAGS